MRLQKIFELTLALYRVTDLFPKDEPLKRQLREKANEILAEAVEYDYSSDEKNPLNLEVKLQVMRGFLEIGRRMRLIKPINVFVLEREYETLTSALKAKTIPKSEKPKNQESVQTYAPRPDSRVLGKESVGTALSWSGVNGLNERQKVIIAEVKQNGTVKISDFFVKFQGVSAKTIQRDLHDLVSKNILKKEGERRWMSYSIV